MLRSSLETVLAVIFSVLAVATWFWPCWIESLIGLEPDGGSGATELGIVVLLAGLALAAGLGARHHYRRALRPRAFGDFAA